MKENYALKDKVKGKPIHSRELDLKTYVVDNDRIVVEGRLKDERFEKAYEIDGRILDPGLVHHLVIRILVGGPPLTILGAEAEMPFVPHDLCNTTEDSIKKVIGLQIKSGFGENVHRLIGGIEGCTHLTHLLITMSQEAVQGYWHNKVKERPPDADYVREMDGLSYMLNSCKLWREDGPLVKEVKGLLDEPEIS